MVFNFTTPPVLFWGGGVLESRIVENSSGRSRDGYTAMSKPVKVRRLERMTSEGEDGEPVKA